MSPSIALKEVMIATACVSDGSTSNYQTRHVSNTPTNSCNESLPLLQNISCNFLYQDEEFFYGGKRQNRRDVSKRANRDHKFAFDVVFGPQSTNEDVFQQTTRDLVDVLFAGMTRVSGVRVVGI